MENKKIKLPKQWWDSKYYWNPITGFRTYHKIRRHISIKKERTVKPLE